MQPKQFGKVITRICNGLGREGGGGGGVGPRRGGGHLVCNDWDTSKCMYRGLLSCPLLVKGDVWR